MNKPRTATSNLLVMLVVFLACELLATQDLKQLPRPPLIPTQAATETPVNKGVVDILTDTQGVNFNPYLQDLLPKVRKNWYSLIPESAQSKRAKIAIEFSISKDGRIFGQKLTVSSGDASLDRPAWGAIANAAPLPPLPTEFKGDSLALRFHFFYNPTKADIYPGMSPSGPAALVLHAHTGPEKAGDDNVLQSTMAPSVLCVTPAKSLTQIEAQPVEDQQGVGLGSYLQDRVLPVLRANWYRAVSNAAGLVGGDVSIEFSLQKDGTLSAAKLAATSGDAELDDIALHAVERSSAFGPLPSEYIGQSLAVRSTLHYQPSPEHQSSGAPGVAKIPIAPPVAVFCSPEQINAKASNCVLPPQAVFSPDPEFSAEARQKKFQGTVTLAVVVGVDGNVQSACAMQPLGYGLDRQAVEAARKWKFVPAKDNDTAVPSQIVLEVEFNVYNDTTSISTSQAKITKILPVGNISAANTKTTGKNASGSSSLFQDCSGNISGCISPPHLIDSSVAKAPLVQNTNESEKPKYSGTATVQLVVSTEGKPQDIKILKSLGTDLDEKTIESVSKWKFAPAMKDGKPVATQIIVEVDFNLN